MNGIHTPFPEGQILFTNPGGFDKLVFTSNIGDYAFGWDQLGTGTFNDPVPEPSTIFLLCAGLAGLGFARGKTKS